MPEVWKMDDASMERLAHRLDELRPAVAVECGPGMSTAILHRFCGWTVSLEHLPEWAVNTFSLMEPKPPGEVRFAPLTTIDTPEGPLPFYRTNLPPQIDFALIDGPPGGLGRRGTFHALWPHLAPSFVVWLDDANRQKEREALHAWQSFYPIEVRRVDKRVAEVTRASRT